MLAEILFIIAVVGAIYVAQRVIKDVLVNRKAKAKISQVINNPKVLKQKLQNPEILAGGKMQRMERVIDEGEEVKIEIKDDGSNIDIGRKEIKPRPAPKPVKDPKAKAKPVKKKISKKTKKKNEKRK